MIFRGIAPNDAEFLKNIANDILEPIYGSHKKLCGSGGPGQDSKIPLSWRLKERELTNASGFFR